MTPIEKLQRVVELSEKAGTSPAMARALLALLPALEALEWVASKCRNQADAVFVAQQCVPLLGAYAAAKKELDGSELGVQPLLDENTRLREENELLRRTVQDDKDNAHAFDAMEAELAALKKEIVTK